ncbi:MAG: FdhF/YdeP family oxidoreductase [Chthonomonadaceae bacterium]|nr:FdhF/YdeP family oxidoreductase [Chthonomonadaceae bacterium]
MRQPRHGGGWRAIAYTLSKARENGPIRFWRAMRTKNACKTCAFGMGGQAGGMRNEAGRFPEVCKKSLQAMASDMQGRIEPRFFETYRLDQLATFSPRELELAGRLAFPIVAGPGDTHFRPVSWDDALDVCADALRASPPERTFVYSSGRSSNEAGFLLQLLARALGTNHVSNCSYYCHQASGAGLKASIGTGTSTVALEDLERCDLLFLIGGNPASNHPRLMSELMRLRRRGGHVVVVNPLREVGLERFNVPSSATSLLFGSEIASLYVQPTIGGDIALLLGIAKRLLESGAVDRAFVDNHTEGWEAFRQRVEDTSWEAVERDSGVSRTEIDAVADLYGASKSTVFSWSMGITHHLHGVENVRWIANLALMRGMVGKPGAGLMPIRGHSNVQGLGSIGVTPQIRAQAAERLGELGLTVPSFEGYDTLATMEAASRREMQVGVCLGGNLFGANPDASFASEALGRVDTLVHLSTTLNTGHVRGRGQTTVILPVRARDEEEQSTTQESMFNYVRLSDGGPARLEGPRGEVQVLAEMGRRAFAGAAAVLDWAELADHNAIRRLIARLVPEFEPVADIGTTKREFHIPGRVLHEPTFRTGSGRARFTDSPVPEATPLGERQLRLMTVRTEGQFNTVVYEETDLYRGQDRRDVILIHPEDLARLGLKPDQTVEVRSEAGTLRAVARPFPIARGCAAMYFPEANVLVPRRADPVSRTPAYKSVVVEVT